MSTIAIHPTYHRRPRPSERQSGRRSVRLTRRGRVVVILLFLGLALALLTALGPRVIATGEQGTPVATTTVVVGEGDTLWDIASKVAEPGQTRAMVRQIVELNALPGVTIYAGQELAVPVE
jgi:LysM repeat protein